MAVDPAKLAGPSEPADNRTEEPLPADAVRGRRTRPGRIGPYLLTLWLLVTLNFFLPRAMPGDPISSMFSATGSASGLSEAERVQAARYYGLDRPLFDQYRTYLSDLSRGNLGVSIRHRRPVVSVLADRLPWTLLLGGTTVVLATVVGLLLGVHSGWRRGRPDDHVLVGAFSLLRSIPPFFSASLALFAFSVKLKWFPLAGGETPFSGFSGLHRLGDVLHHLALPAVTTALLFASSPYLLMRAGMVGELGSDHLLVGRAKGLADRRLKYSYAARNALLPLVTLTSLELGVAITGGLVFVERVFAYPGIGQLLFESAGLRDYPMLQGTFLVLALVIITLNALTDAIYARVDPRTR